MKKKLFRMLFFRGGPLLLVCLSFNARGQTIKRQSISSYATNISGVEVQAAQTAGQSFYTKTSYNEVGVLQGFQQPKIFSLEEIKAPFEIPLNVIVSPNPASHFLYFKADNAIEECIINVVTSNGALISFEKIPSLSYYEMNCSSWVNGVYLITISDKYHNKQTLRLLISK